MIVVFGLGVLGCRDREIEGKLAASEVKVSACEAKASACEAKATVCEARRGTLEAKFAEEERLMGLLSADPTRRLHIPSASATPPAPRPAATGAPKDLGF